MKKRYRTIVADPPWEHPDTGARTLSTRGNWKGKWLGYESKLPYERMTLDAIKALPVPDLAEDDAHLYLWTTNGFLRHGYEVVEAWGFKPSTLLTWCKAPMGLGLGGGPYVELFARRARFGWDYWGDQSLGTAEMVA